MLNQKQCYVCKKKLITSQKQVICFQCHMAEEDSVSLMDIEIEEEEMNRKEYIAERKLTTDDHVVEAEEFFDWCDACGCVECCCEELDEIQE